MAENPDHKDDAHNNFIPSGGDLRFVKREVNVDDGLQTSPVKTLRILQRWEWSYVAGKWDWYDVPLMEE